MTGPELAFLYLFGLLDALQLKYNNRVLVCVLVYAHNGVLNNAGSEPAEFFIIKQQSSPAVCSQQHTAALLLAVRCLLRASVRMRQKACVRARVRTHQTACVADTAWPTL